MYVLSRCAVTQRLVFPSRFFCFLLRCSRPPVFLKDHRPTAELGVNDSASSKRLAPGVAAPQSRPRRHGPRARAAHTHHGTRPSAHSAPGRGGLAPALSNEDVGSARAHETTRKGRERPGGVPAENAARLVRAARPGRRVSPHKGPVCSLCPMFYVVPVIGPVLWHLFQLSIFTVLRSS